METITIDEIKHILKYKDLRAVRKWCYKNQVYIIKQGKNEFVCAVEFKFAFDRPIITRYQNKYGDNWEWAYELTKDGVFPAEVPVVNNTQFNRVLKRKKAL